MCLAGFVYRQGLAPRHRLAHLRFAQKIAALCAQAPTLGDRRVRCLRLVPGSGQQFVQCIRNGLTLLAQ